MQSSSSEGFYACLTQQFGMFENSPLLFDLFTGLYESGLFESVLTPAVKISSRPSAVSADRITSD